jgi:hypothetical protein
MTPAGSQDLLFDYDAFASETAVALPAVVIISPVFAALRIPVATGKGNGS